jgi:hypothetical protein
LFEDFDFPIPHIKSDEQTRIFDTTRAALDVSRFSGVGRRRVITEHNRTKGPCFTRTLSEIAAHVKNPSLRASSYDASCDSIGAVVFHNTEYEKRESGTPMTLGDGFFSRNTQHR